MKTSKVLISCSGKFHAFNLAEQLEQQEMLHSFWTTFAYQKNKSFRGLTSRIDQEKIPSGKIHSILPIAFGIKLFYHPHFWNELFDLWVASQLGFYKNNFNVFVGWSGMSLHSIREAKRLGKITIVERGSAHIQYQDSILKEEYRKFGIDFKIDPRVVKKEITEYQESEYISIPSTFVHDSFTQYGVSSQKLLLNPYGTSNYFEIKSDNEQHQIFTVLYVGVLSIRKGLIYLFQALEELNDQFTINALFIGKIDQELKQMVAQYQLKFKNWKFLGHVNHYQLPELISACHVAVVPSIEDGFGMIVSQILACGVPVIVSENTGGKDIVEEGKTGFIVPIRSADAIAVHIKYLIENPEVLIEMKMNTSSQNRYYGWDRYGDQYAHTIIDLVNAKYTNLHG